MPKNLMAKERITHARLETRRKSPQPFEKSGENVSRYFHTFQIFESMKSLIWFTNCETLLREFLVCFPDKSNFHFFVVRSTPIESKQALVSKCGHAVKAF